MSSNKGDDKYRSPVSGSMTQNVLFSGASLAACFKAAEVAPENSTFCVMLPDTGERYLSSPLFEDITDESDEQWLTNALGA